MDWESAVFSRLRKTVHFPATVSEEVAAAERHDLAARDVPYFWVNAGDAVIQHHTGPKQRLFHRWNAREQAIKDIGLLSRRDVNAQAKVLSDFLDADLHAASRRAHAGLA